MENKELKINIPEGYEIDKENSTFECIKFKKKKEESLTYIDIARELFYNKTTYCAGADSKIINFNCNLDMISLPNNSTSEKQVKKLLALNKLMNVAKYLNKSWKPYWNDPNEYKYSPRVNSEGKIYIAITMSYSDGLVFFKNETLTKQAIDILGEDTIRLALSTDW